MSTSPLFSIVVEMVGDIAALPGRAVFIGPPPTNSRQLLVKVSSASVSPDRSLVTPYKHHRTLAALYPQGMEHGEQRRQAGTAR